MRVVSFFRNILDEGNKYDKWRFACVYLDSINGLEWCVDKAHEMSSETTEMSSTIKEVDSNILSWCDHEQSGEDWQSSMYLSLGGDKWPVYLVCRRALMWVRRIVPSRRVLDRFACVAWYQGSIHSENERIWVGENERIWVGKWEDLGRKMGGAGKRIFPLHEWCVFVAIVLDYRATGLGPQIYRFGQEYRLDTSWSHSNLGWDITSEVLCVLRRRICSSISECAPFEAIFGEIGHSLSSLFFRQRVQVNHLVTA